MACMSQAQTCVSHKALHAETCAGHLVGALTPTCPPGPQDDHYTGECVPLLSRLLRLRFLLVNSRACMELV